MNSLAADLLVVWLVATAACSGLFLAVVVVQDTLAHVRRHRARRRRRLPQRTALPTAAHPG